MDRPAPPTPVEPHTGDAVFLVNPANAVVLERGAAHYRGRSPLALVLVSVVLLAMWVIAVAWLLREVHAHFALKGPDGRTMTATVTGLRSRPASDGTPDATFHVEFAYTPPEAGGRTLAGSAQVWAAVYHALDKGGPIAIRYSASAPEVSRPVDGATRSPWLLGLLAVAFAAWSVLPVLVFRQGLAARRLNGLLRAGGRLLEGEVVMSRLVLPEKKGQPHIVTRCRFRLPGGAEREEEKDSPPSPHRAAPAPGTPVRVLYAADDAYDIL